MTMQYCKIVNLKKSCCDNIKMLKVDCFKKLFALLQIIFRSS